MSIILTDHAKQRMRKRRLALSDIEKTVAHPERTSPGKKPGTVKFIRTLDGRLHQVVGTYLEKEKQWLILSVWVRGEDDRDGLTELFSFLGKIVLKIVSLIPVLIIRLFQRKK
jgi:hypothetical protein